jgi:hypothetical protein
MVSRNCRFFFFAKEVVSNTKMCKSAKPCLKKKEKKEGLSAEIQKDGFSNRADPVPEAPTRVGSGEGNNRSKVLPLQKFCRETASNPGPSDSAS